MMAKTMNNAQPKLTDAQLAILDLNWNNLIDTASIVIDQQGLCNTVGALKLAIERKQKFLHEDSQNYKDLQFARDILAAVEHGCDLNGSYQTRRKAISDVLEDIANIEVVK